MLRVVCELAAIEQTVPVGSATSSDQLRYIPNFEDRSFLGTLGYFGVRALLAVSPANLPRIGEHGAAVAIDWRVLGFTLGISLLTGILFGLFPAIGASRPDLNTALKESSNRSGTAWARRATNHLGRRTVLL